MELKDKDVLVLGLGMTGWSAARFCAARGARVVAADERPESAIEDLDSLRAVPGVREVITGAPFPDPADFDVTVPSPGVARARYGERARRAWGDIELAGRALAVPIVAVTGTNGKSTTVRLIEAMLGAAGLRARAAGNVGTPVLGLVGDPLDVAVLEVSSFQLEATESFRPNVAVVLNVTPDHLDRHGDLAGYAAAKQRLLAHQLPEDVAVLSFDDPLVRDMAKHTRAEVLPVSCRAPIVDTAIRRAAWLDTGAVVLRNDGDTTRIDLTAGPLAGAHNRENVLAALAAAWVSGADPHAAARALADFRPLPHRSQLVATLAGLRWVDDSKATNPGAAIRALEGAAGRVIWIAGGRGKDLPFDALADAAQDRVVHALLLGEAAGEIERTLAGRVECERVDDIETAVRRAAAVGQDADVVLLAPGCSSLDQFKSFEERGERFQRAVRSLEQEAISR